MGNMRHCILCVIVIIIACGAYGGEGDEVYVRSTYQGTSGGPIKIIANKDVKFIMLENTSSGPDGRAIKMDGWKLKCTVDRSDPVTYIFDKFMLEPGKSVKIYGRQYASEAGVDDLVFRDEGSWGEGPRVDIELSDEKNMEMARLTMETTSY